MVNKYNYYEINSYCKSEGLDTEFFIVNYNKNKSRRMRRLIKMVNSIFV